MKPGARYEQFVYDKFNRLFADAVVTKNDKILGHESGLQREIDVSVRFNIDNKDVLYVAQCKDWESRADINVLGEFASVIQDVRAAKGFLLCTSGFAKTNRQYALSKGIELITIEDIKSDRWTIEVQIPIVYVRKKNDFVLTLAITANEALAERNQGSEITIQFSNSLLTIDGAKTTIGFDEFAKGRLQSLVAAPTDGAKIDIGHPYLEMLIADVWVPCSVSVTLLPVTRTSYLKYVTPREYSQLRDHVRGTVLPLHVVLEQVGLRLDETFVELPDGKVPVFPGLSIEVEESSLGDGSESSMIEWTSFNVSLS